MAKNTIKLKNYSNINEEYEAHEIITPGMLVELNSDNEVQKHATADGNTIPMFLVEDELQGKGIDDNCAAADQVQIWIPYRGDQVNALLADGENVAIGDFLTSAGTGKLKKFDVAASAGIIEAPALIVGVALEAVDMSGSAGADPSGRIKVRIV